MGKSEKRFQLFENVLAHEPIRATQYEYDGKRFAWPVIVEYYIKMRFQFEVRLRQHFCSNGTKFRDYKVTIGIKRVGPDK